MSEFVKVHIDYGFTTRYLEDKPLDTDCTRRSADEVMGWIVDNVPWESDSLERIMRHAVVLHELGKGTFGECLNQATIWECG